MAREHVLAVDDEDDVLELIRYNLERAGYRVSCATSGEEATVGPSSPHPTGRTITLTLRTVPEDVTVRLDGQEQPDPHRIIIPRGVRPRRVVISAPGYRPRALRVVPLGDRHRVVRLMPIAR